jgi:tyrosinase
MAQVTLTRYDITDLNNGAIEGFPVDNPPGWDAISLWYAKALQKMGWNPSGKGPWPAAPQNGGSGPVPGTPNVANTWNYSEPADPGSYFFWGAMHWWPGNKWEYWNKNAPKPQNEYWSHCTHGPAHVEKYFLPWHRAYIYCYEVAIRRKVVELGGPANWSLPYWNYSYYKQPSGPTPWPRSCLPWVFCQAKLPDGSPNPLALDTGRRGLQPKWPTTGQTMFLNTSTPYYAGAYGQQTWEPRGTAPGFNSTLDGRPHGAVHNDTGNGDGYLSQTGWMQFTQTAGFDPIFWLHHSEIDRFWVGWNAAGGENPDQQTDPAWATASDDPIKQRWNFWLDAKLSDVVVIHPGDMVDPAKLDPARFPHSYQFQNLPTVPAPRQGGRATVADAVERLAVPAAPAAGITASEEREIASSDQPIEVTHDAVTTQVPLASEAPTVLRTLDADVAAEPPRVTLHLDDIVTQGPPANYEVYLNNPEVGRDTAGQVPHFVGLFSAFGADHHHGEHEGHHGVSATYDITDVVAYLREQGEWDESKAQVTFVPALPPVEDLKPVTGPVTIGSVRIVTQQKD